MPFPLGKDFDLSEAHLTEVGRIAIEWSHLEFALERVVWEFLRLGASLEERYSFTTHIGVRTRIDIIGSYLRARGVGAEVIERWNGLEMEIQEQHRWRNLVIHHKWWGLSNTAQMITHRSARNRGVMTRTYDADVENLKATAADIRSLREDLEEWTVSLTRVLSLGAQAAPD